MRPSPVVAALLVLEAACAQKPNPDPGLPPLPARPLSGLGAQAVIVLPVRFLRPGDPMGWAARLPDTREFLARVDEELAFAVRQRNAAPQWTWSAELSRLARRNPTYAPDPHEIDAEPLREARPHREAEILPDPLRSQLRALVALRDARYALVPVEVRFEPRGGGGSGRGRAVLHLALVDARTAQVVWSGEVASESETGVTPALAASLGERFADLVAAP